jgi:hypothetical protein
MSNFPIHDMIVATMDEEKYLVAYPDVYTEQLEWDIGNYLSNYEREHDGFQWSLSVVEYPAADGGTVFLAFIENGILTTFTWDYENITEEVNYED